MAGTRDYQEKTVEVVKLSVNDKAFVILSSERVCVKEVHKVSMHSIFHHLIHTLVTILVLS